jgi:cytochrome P450
MQRPSLGSAATRSEQSLDPAAPPNGLGAPDSTEPRRLVPPRPAVPNSVPPWYWPVDVLRMDPLCVWPEQAYEDDTYVRNFLGLKRRLLNSPTAIRHVLIDNIGNYRRAPGSARILRTLAGNGLLLAEGDEWKHQRRTIAPALTPRSVPVLARHAVTAAEETVAELRAAGDAPVDLLAAMQQLALEIAGRSMFSLEMGEHGPALRDYIVRFAAGLGRASLIDMILPGTVSAPRDFARRRYHAQWMQLIDGIMESRMQASATDAPRDLFDLLVAARDPDTGAPFTRPQLRDQVATMIAAGHETTGTTLFWSLYLLALAPWEQDRMAAEVRDIEIGAATVEQALPRLVYTKAVISEALRLYPPAYTISRQAIGDDRIEGIEIAAGSQVVVLPWVLHRHRRLWKDPDAFDPIRFLPDAPQPDRFAYLPFSTGPRVCVGAAFAMAEAMLILAMLIRTFRVEIDDPEPILPVASVTLHPNRPGRFRLRPRSELAA